MGFLSTIHRASCIVHRASRAMDGHQPSADPILLLLDGHAILLVDVDAAAVLYIHSTPPLLLHPKLEYLPTKHTTTRKLETTEQHNTTNHLAYY
jgi:hypothetical protein